jgi:hypothetical protein
MSNIEQINSEDLLKWTKGELEGENPFFIIVKTPTCAKCMALLSRVKFEKPEWFRIFNFKPDDKVGAELLSKLNLSAVPVVLYRFKIKVKNFYKYEVDKVIPDYDDQFTEFSNLLEAFFEKEYQYFDLDEYGAPKDDEKISTLGLVYNEIYSDETSEAAKNRELLKREITK